MGLNSIGGNLPILDLGIKFGDIAKGAVGAFNTQQQRGEEREKALAENAMAKLNLQYAPREKEANLKNLDAQALYQTLLAQYYPDLARSQIGEHSSHGRLYSNQADVAENDLRLRKQAIEALQNYANNKGQQQGLDTMPNIGSGNPLSQTIQPEPMAGGIPWKQPGAIQDNQVKQKSASEVAQEYPAKRSGANDLYEAVKQDPMLGFALEQAGFKMPDVESKADIAKNERLEKAYTEAVASARDAGDMVETLTEVKNLIDELPEDVQNAVGPFSHLWSKYNGDPETQRAMGSIMTLGRDLQADYARKLSQRVTDKDLQLAKGAKFDEQTPFNVMVGQLQTLFANAETLKNRYNLRAELYNKGYLEHEVDKIVRERYPRPNVAKKLKEMRAETAMSKSFTKAEREAARDSFGGKMSLEDL